MTRFEALPAALRVLLLLSCASALGCKQDPNRVAGYAAAIDELQAALCDCKTDPDACMSEALIPECTQHVVEHYQDQIASWLACATKETRARAACARDTGCAEDRLDSCGGLDVEEVCGEVPDGPQMAIERDLDLKCRDGSRSDSSDSSDGSGRSTGTAVPTVSVSPPMVTTPPPAPQPTCTATPETLARVGASCVSCACKAAPFEVTACDETCWRLLACAREHCSMTDASDQIACVTMNCSEDLGGAEAAGKLGPILQASCESACPSLR